MENKKEELLQNLQAAFDRISPSAYEVSQRNTMAGISINQWGLDEQGRFTGHLYSQVVYGKEDNTNDDLAIKQALGNVCLTEGLEVYELDIENLPDVSKCVFRKDIFVRKRGINSPPQRSFAAQVSGLDDILNKRIDEQEFFQLDVTPLEEAGFILYLDTVYGRIAKKKGELVYIPNDSRCHESYIQGPMKLIRYEGNSHETPHC